MMNVNDLIDTVGKIVTITDEMKKEYPVLKDYTDIIIMSKNMTWWSADFFGDENDFEMPDIDTMRAIISLLIIPKYLGFWTGEIYNEDIDCAWVMG